MTFNIISDGDPGISAPVMQNWKHVNFGSPLIPVDATGAGVNNTIDLGSAAFGFKDFKMVGDIAVNTNKFRVTGATGNTSVAGTFDAFGAAQLLSTCAVTDDFSINTNKFTVTAASGNTLVAGTLGVTGTVTVNSNKFSVDGSTGNTAVLGDFAINTNKFTVSASTGNTLVAGTLGVTSDFQVNTSKFTVTAATGNTLVAGTLGVTSDFAVNTNKFTVAASTGNTLVAGTLGVTSDFAINTNKFTVAASTGNTLVAGTLGVTSDFAINTNKFTVSASTGNTLVAGTLGVTSTSILSGLVGIKTTPSYALDVLRGAANGAVASFSGSNTGRGLVISTFARASADDSIDYNTIYSGLGAHTWSVNSVEKMRLTEQGSLGVGTTGPDRKLDILDASNPQLRLTQADGSKYVDFQADSDGYLLVSPSGLRSGFGKTPAFAFDISYTDDALGAVLSAERIRTTGAISSINGVLRVGVKDADAALSANGGPGVFFFYTDSSYTNQSMGYFGMYNDGAYNEAGYKFYGGTNGTEQLFMVTSTGSFGIGTTGPDRKLDILDASNPQLRLTQADGSVYSDFQTDSNGHLTVTITGDEIALPSAGLNVDSPAFTHNDGITSGSAIRLVYDSTSYTPNLDFIGKDSASNETIYGRITGGVTSATSGAEKGYVEIQAHTNGATIPVASHGYLGASTPYHSYLMGTGTIVYQDAQETQGAATLSGANGYLQVTVDGNTRYIQLYDTLS